MKLSPAEVTALLTSTNPAPLATVATVRADGAPQAVPVWFFWDEEGALVIEANQGSAWVTSLERDPRVTVVVAQQAPPYATVIARGSASLQRCSKIESLSTIRRLTERYLSPEQVEPYIEDVGDTEKVIVSIVPASMTTWSFHVRSKADS